MAEYFIGEIRIFGNAKVPENWAPCDGRVMQISGNEALYSLIGTTYGGSGATFNLPDLRGRLAIGQGTGAALTPRLMGQQVGSATVTLDATNLPPHTHVLQATSATAATATPGAATMLATTTEIPIYEPGADTTKRFALNSVAVSAAPAAPATAHDNMMPTIALNYMIALSGLYPQRP